MARLLTKNLQLHCKHFSTSTVARSLKKASVLLVNHGYPPLFNAGSEVIFIFLYEL